MNRGVVDHTLQWVITPLSFKNIHIYQESLAHQPKDGCCSGISSVMLDNSTVSIKPDFSRFEDLHVGDAQSFVPTNDPSKTEQEDVCDCR